MRFKYPRINNVLLDGLEQGFFVNMSVINSSFVVCAIPIVGVRDVIDARSRTGWVLVWVSSSWMYYSKEKTRQVRKSSPGCG